VFWFRVAPDGRLRSATPDGSATSRRSPPPRLRLRAPSRGACSWVEDKRRQPGKSAAELCIVTACQVDTAANGGEGRRAD